MYDKFPVTHLHCLVIPKRHTGDYFEISQAETNAINQLLHSAKQFIIKQDNAVTGFNIGINCGETAGQTVAHTHLHLIPRRPNDVVNPKGGIRNLIDGKGDYTATSP